MEAVQDPGSRPCTEESFFKNAWPALLWFNGVYRGGHSEEYNILATCKPIARSLEHSKKCAAVVRMQAGRLSTSSVQIGCPSQLITWRKAPFSRKKLRTFPAYCSSAAVCDRIHIT